MNAYEQLDCVRSGIRCYEHPRGPGERMLAMLRGDRPRGLAEACELAGYHARRACSRPDVSAVVAGLGPGAFQAGGSHP